ncbi:MAG: PAS domain-containing protein [Anaerolineae bacterium]|nr:PAS domain-containing protein [Anaerolineae bacterium]
MTTPLIHPALAPLIALLFYSGILVFLLRQRRWSETLIRRLIIYVGLMALSALAMLVASLDVVEEVKVVSLRLFVYAHTTLPLLFYLFARAFVRQERRPHGIIIGTFFLILLIALDLSQISFELAFGVFSSDILVSIVRVGIWLAFSGLVALFSLREYQRQISPLHRNRLLYLALAWFPLSAEGALEILWGVPIRPLSLTLQVLGAIVIVYAALQHHLVDLRMLGRQAVYVVVMAAFSLTVYALVVGAAIMALRETEQWQMWGGAALVAVLLTIVYQPLRSWLRRKMRALLFGQRYSPQSIVQDFSQRLSARIDLEELAREGRTLLEKAMGARAVTLVLVTHYEKHYILRPVLAPEDVSPEIQLDEESSVARTLVRAQPLLQYDVDRLPQYADLPNETRVALQKLRGEVFVPIQSRGVWIGMWVIGAKISGDRYTDTDLTLLMTLADQSAVALENARLLADLRAQMTQIRSMRDYLDSTLASIATGVVTLNHENKIISFNRAAEQIFRTPVSKAIGRPFDQVLPALEGVDLNVLIKRVWQEETTPVVRDVTARVFGRGIVHLTLQFSALRRGDNIAGVVIVIEDLTEQARLEMQRRAQEQETQRVRATFEHYVAPNVVKELLADPRRVTLGGKRQLVTVLFADIHGFTNLAEQLPPEDLVKVLNGYLSLAARIILHYEGTLDKFMGDGVMAIFNAPLPQRDHAWRAACAALALQREVAAYASKLPETVRTYFRMGIHTGEAVVGNIGARELMNYTAVGDPVNVAKRLQENAESNQILISRATYTLIESKVLVRSMETLAVRGRATPVEVFELIGVRGEHTQVS